MATKSKLTVIGLLVSLVIWSSLGILVISLIIKWWKMPYNHTLYLLKFPHLV